MGSFSKSLSAFYPSRGGFEEGFEASSWYWAFHALAIFYITVLLVALFGREMLNRLSIVVRMLRKHPLNVFWGYGEEAKTIAQGISDGKDSVVFVMPESKRLWTGLNDEDDIHAVAKAGWKWITGKSSARRSLIRAKRHFGTIRCDRSEQTLQCRRGIAAATAEHVVAMVVEAITIHHRFTHLRND